MLKLLKNVLLTALLVAVATVATSVCAAFVAMLMGMSASPAPAAMHGYEIVFHALIALVGSLLVGMLFCFATLFIAALTMPPTLGLARWLKLRRPAVDMIGGAGAGLWCAMGALEFLHSDKFAGMITAPVAQMIATLGLLLGCLLGLLRHAIL